MINNKRELAKILNVSYKQLTYILYVRKIENCYTSFKIPKKDGSTRTISAPYPTLKYIQKNLAEFLYKQKSIINESYITTRNLFSHGFEQDKNIITNAEIHKSKKIVINLDLENFFDSFHIGRVIGYFNNNKNFSYPLEVATMIGQIACYNGTLPQGAPSSPIITNLIGQILDNNIFKVAKKYKLHYTRFVDDLTFSTNDKKFLDNQDNFFDELSETIINNGFVINTNKTRISFCSSKQVVTGLIVNKKINIDNEYYKTTRAMADRYYKTGKIFIDHKEASIHQLEGRFAFINQIDKHNNKNNKKSFQLNRRETEYQKFLFFKNFLNIDKPIIITEGKTDPLYIKAALKSLYNKYPNLIEKINDKFIFKFKFFNKSSIFEYLFRLSQTGGDALQKIPSIYNGSSPYQKCKQLIDKYKITSLFPVIILLDNEEVNKDKPLKKFINSCQLTKTQLNNFHKNNFIRIFANHNLYLTTFPLVDKKTECEIEDLLGKQVNNVIIDNKTFKNNVDKNDANYFSKDALSKYVYTNYQDFNFDNFCDLLDNISNIIKNYLSK